MVGSPKGTDVPTRDWGVGEFCTRISATVSIGRYTMVKGIYKFYSVQSAIQMNSPNKVDGASKSR